jgi:predicted NUDIX family phosphoesterase
MYYIVFKRESNKFDDILSDTSIKKVYKTKIVFHHHLIMGIEDYDPNYSKILSYILLKFGDDIIDMNSLIKDYSPIPNKDYTPKKNK